MKFLKLAQLGLFIVALAGLPAGEASARNKCGAPAPECPAPVVCPAAEAPPACPACVCPAPPECPALPVVVKKKRKGPHQCYVPVPCETHSKKAKSKE
jgi:hypothetical protein